MATTVTASRRRDAAAARVQASDAMLYTIGFGGGSTCRSLRAGSRATRGPRAENPTFRRTPRSSTASSPNRDGAVDQVRPLVFLDQRPPGRHVAADHREGQKRQLRHSSARRLSRQRSPAGRKVSHGQNATVAGSRVAGSRVGGRYSRDLGSDDAVGAAAAVATTATATTRRSRRRPSRTRRRHSGRASSWSRSTSASSIGRDSRCAA